MRKILFLAAVFVISAAVTANAQDIHPIDKEMDECFEQNPTTFAAADCITAATAKWDSVLNKYYKLLKDMLSEEDQKILRDAQREWIDFRDKEIELIGTLYTQNYAARYVVSAESDIMNITRDRAVKLKEFYEFLLMDE